MNPRQSRRPVESDCTSGCTRHRTCRARIPDLSIHEHVALAERHAQRALDLAYNDEPQGFRVRYAIGKAQSLLISLITNGRLR